MPLPTRTWKLIDQSGECWLWLGHIDQFGYGKRKRRGAHRTIYEELVGPVADGFELDHLCRVKSCVNPEHLEQVTHLENIRRRYVGYDTCSQGHLYDDGNTYIRPTGHRDCRACIRARSLAYYHRKRTAA
jgi:hypothetical protein